MINLSDKSDLSIALVPFVGSRQTEEFQWLGALLARLLAQHLDAAGLPVYPYDDVATEIAESKLDIPLSEEGMAILKRQLKLNYLVQGRFVVDDDTKMVGLRMIAETTQGARTPLEVSSPTNRFPQFIEQISLALVEQLGGTVDDAVRKKIGAVPRPATFEAFRQLSMAILGWSRGQNQLALTSVASALALDQSLEEAAGIEAAIAREANDATTTRAAFRRWTAIAASRGRPLVAAERLQMLGHWLAERGEWGDARKAYEDAGNIYNSEDSDVGKAQVSNNIAHLDMLQGKLQASIQAYRRSITIFKASPESEGDLAATFYNLAVAHKSLGQADEAYKALEEALSLSRRLKDTYLEGCCLAQRGALHDDQGQWGRAASDYQQASTIFEQLGEDRQLALVRSHQGVLRKQQGDYSEAENLMLEALRLFEAGGDPHEQAVIWFNLADLYYSMNLIDAALEQVQKAHQAFSQLKSGWTSRARQLMQTLERLPRTPMAETASPPDLELDLPDSSAFEPSGPDDEAG